MKLVGYLLVIVIVIASCEKHSEAPAQKDQSTCIGAICSTLVATSEKQQTISRSFVASCRDLAAGKSDSAKDGPDPKAAWCLTSIAPALYISRNVGRFDLAGQKVCVPESAGVLSVANEIVAQNTHEPAYPLDNPNSMVILAISSLYRCK